MSQQAEVWNLRKSSTYIDKKGESSKALLAKFMNTVPDLDKLKPPVRLYLEREQLPVSSDEEEEEEQARKGGLGEGGAGAMGGQSLSPKKTGDGAGSNTGSGEKEIPGGGGSGQGSGNTGAAEKKVWTKPRRRRRLRPGALHWHLEENRDFEDGGFKMLGSKEGGLKSRYVLFQVMEEEGAGLTREIHVAPVGDWYNFRKPLQHLTLGSTEAEEHMKSSGRSGVARWGMSSAKRSAKARLMEKLEKDEEPTFLAKKPSSPGKDKSPDKPNMKVVSSTLKLGYITNSGPKGKPGSRGSTKGLGAAGEDPEDVEGVDGMGDDGNDFEEVFDDDDPEIEDVPNKDVEEPGVDRDASEMEDSEEESDLDDAGREIKKIEEKWKTGEFGSGKAGEESGEEEEHGNNKIISWTNERTAKPETSKDDPSGQQPKRPPSRGTPEPPKKMPKLDPKRRPKTESKGGLSEESVRSVMKLYGGRIRTKDLLGEFKKQLKENVANKDRFRLIVKKLSNVVEDNVEGKMLVLKPEYL